MEANIRLFLTVLALSVISFTLSWNPNSIPDSSYDYVSTVWSSSRQCAMSGNNDNGGNIIASSDGGVSWNIIFSGNDQLRDIATTTYSGTTYFISVSTVGSIILIKNVAGNYLRQTVSALSGSSLYGVGIFNDTAYAVGQKGFGSGIGSAVYKSVATSRKIFTDWKVVTLPPGQQVTYSAVTTYDGINVIVAGYTGTVLHSSNGGKRDSVL